MPAPDSANAPEAQAVDHSFHYSFQSQFSVSDIRPPRKANVRRLPNQTSATFYRVQSSCTLECINDNIVQDMHSKLGAKNAG